MGSLLQVNLHTPDLGSVRNVLQLLAERGHPGILVLQDSDDVVEQSDVPAAHTATSPSVRPSSRRRDYKTTKYRSRNQSLQMIDWFESTINILDSMFQQSLVFDAKVKQVMRFKVKTCWPGSPAAVDGQTDRRTDGKLLVVLLENLLVHAGLGVGDLVQTGYFEAKSVSSLALVHVVPTGQNHLQDLRQGATLNHLLGRQLQSWNRNMSEKGLVQRSKGGFGGNISGRDSNIQNIKNPQF